MYTSVYHTYHIIIQYLSYIIQYLSYIIQYYLILYNVILYYTKFILYYTILSYFIQHVSYIWCYRSCNANKKRPGVQSRYANSNLYFSKHWQCKYYVFISMQYYAIFIDCKLYILYFQTYHIYERFRQHNDNEKKRKKGVLSRHVHKTLAIRISVYINCICTCCIFIIY